MSDQRLISTASAEEAIYHALQLFVGRGRAWSCEDLATALTAGGHETKGRTVQSWIAGDPGERRTPPSDVLLKLFQLLDRPFTAKVLGAIGQGAYSTAPLHLLPPQVIAVLSEGLSEFAVRGIDGIYCNVDQGELERFADKMIEVLTPFSTKVKE